MFLERGERWADQWEGGVHGHRDPDRGPERRVDSARSPEQEPFGRGPFLTARLPAAVRQYPEMTKNIGTPKYPIRKRGNVAESSNV
ncbi:hypothetical protein J8F10_22680 [Gemmata sp. G18]|uniref:Uncharacterized protein n=1 Tax=Gemmata palustris TaxID=2822762 RepID=A0ABS5BWH8_9BACT|nr:hypothetical protein [Gemmata palustris]MBP3958069.1 hypothetical protein [Gemmata palustris]